MNHLHFGPLITAAVTPFDKDMQIDLNQFKKLLDHLLKTGTTSLVITGTTGEAPTLNAIEKLKLWECAMDHVDKRIPVIVGVGTNNTKTTLHNIKLAEEVGVDGLLVVAPYYNKPSQKGLLAHFTQIARSTNLPILLYNIPSRCGVELELKTILALAKLPNIIGIKDSTGNVDLLKALHEKLGRNFLLYTGDDSLYMETLALGGHGVISVASHLVGTSMRRIHDLFETGFAHRSVCLDEKLQPFYKAIFTHPNPSPIKALLNLKGIEVGGVRLPLATLEDFEAKILLEKVEEMGVL